MQSPIDWSRILTMLLVVIAGAIVALIAWTLVHAIAHTLLIFILASVVAFMLVPLVDQVERVTRQRWAAVLLVYIGVAAFLVSSFALLAGPFVAQSQSLAQNLPRYIENLQVLVDQADQFFTQYGLSAAGEQAQNQALRYLQESGASLLLNLVNIAGAVANVFLELVLILVIAFYLLLDGQRVRERALALVPADHRSKALFVFESVARVLGGYLRGQLLMALTIGLMAGIGATLFGLPYSLVIGVLAGLFELVPMFGAILGALPALVIALFLPFPTVLWVGLYFLIIQQIENNVLVPRITSHAVGIHPLGAIFALLAGLELGGFIGALFAVPVAGILSVLVGTAYRRVVGVEEPAPRRWWFVRRGRGASPSSSAAPSTASPPSEHS